MGRQRRRQSEGTQQTRVRAWAGSVKGQVHDKSRTREPFGERCGQMSDTVFLKPMLLKTDKTGLDYLWANSKSSGSTSMAET